MWKHKQQRKQNDKWHPIHLKFTLQYNTLTFYYIVKKTHE